VGIWGIVLGGSGAAPVCKVNCRPEQPEQYLGRKEYDIGTPVPFVCFASKVTEIGRISVVMYVSDQFVDGKMQLTHYRDPSTKLGFWVGTRLKRQQKRF